MGPLIPTGRRASSSRQAASRWALRVAKETEEQYKARMLRKRKEIYDFYLSHTRHINNWDLVDLAAHQVVGRYLVDKPRKILYKLARSKNRWERRTAILSTAHFIRKGDTDDAFKIAEILVRDKEDFVQKAAGWMLRFAGDKDRKRLIRFLDTHAAAMSRVVLRNAIEKLDRKQREHYLGLTKE